MGWWDWDEKTPPPKNANFIPNNHKYRNFDYDPDVEKIARMGLKAVKSHRALKNYEKTGEPVYDSMGAYKEGRNAVNIAHHTELKKNDDKNYSKYSKAAENYITKDFAPSVGQIYKQQKSDERTAQLNNGLSYVKKKDNNWRAWTHLDGTEGFSTSKNREINARIKKNYTVVGGRGRKNEG